jgi:transcriptional regulator with GAF, ATPase, and Fis domain
MTRLRAALDRVAASESTLLLRGETGTGKGLAARLVHAASGRSAGPFVHVDCAALAPTVIESELFGHERGAFTGASDTRVGRLEAAARGTLFLDEVGELEPRLQAKLLRVLQERDFERVGGSRTLPMTARVIAATHRDLRRAVSEGGFRADLYFRLQVVEVELPPLRERLEDLRDLVASLLGDLAREMGRAAPVVGESFLAALTGHAWPGNVRELRNLLERLLVRGAAGRLERTAFDGAFEPGWLRDTAAPEPVAGGYPDERARIADALVATGGNVARAARRLGVARSTLRNRIARHGLGHLIPKD